MGQTPSSAAPQDNASTRTLHSSSINSRRPMSLFRRIQNRLHPHPARRFGRYRPSTTAHHHNGPVVDPAIAATYHNTLLNAGPTSLAFSSGTGNGTRHLRRPTTASNTSSVRRATLAATRAAAAATGPPPSLLESAPAFIHPPSIASSSAASTASGVSSRSDLSHMLSEIITSAILSSLPPPQQQHRQQQEQQQQQEQGSTTAINNRSSDSVSIADNSNSYFRYYIQVPIGEESRVLPIIIMGYRNSTLELPYPHRPRPRSTVSTSSSLATLQSMPLSVHSNRTQAVAAVAAAAAAAAAAATSQQQQQQQQAPPSASPPPPPPTSSSSTTTGAQPGSSEGGPNGGGGQWVIYVLSGQAANPVLSDRPTYEDLLWLSNIIGPARPVTTTLAAIDAAIPVIPWSEDTKRRMKGTDRCLVCLDDFVAKEAVRVLKCSHGFHQECVDRWLCETHNSCPVCRGVPVE